MVKLTDPLAKLIIMENKWILTNHQKYGNIYLNDDLPPDIKNERRTLRDISKFAQQLGYKVCKVSGLKLMVENKVYRYNTLYLLPKELQFCNVKTRYVADGLGFQGEDSFLTNLFPATFRMEQLTFSCAEQAYLFFKMRAWKRDDTATQIMEMSNPHKMKVAGDNIPSTAVWEQHKEGFMRSIA